MNVWKDKSGKKITAKEFAKRFKEGVDNITPIQKLKNEVRSTFTMFLGYVLGLVSLIIYREAFVVQWFTYALIIIFLGASWSNGIKYLAIRTQLKMMKNFEVESIDLNKVIQSLVPVKEEVEELTEEEVKLMADTAVKMSKGIDPVAETMEEVKEESGEKDYVEEQKDEVIETMKEVKDEIGEKDEQEHTHK